MSETYDKRLDGERLGKQLDHVRVFMLNAEMVSRWLTLREIANWTGYPEASISARLRDLRRLGYVVDKRRRGNPKAGLFEYKVSKPVLIHRSGDLFAASAPQERA